MAFDPKVELWQCTITKKKSNPRVTSTGRYEIRRHWAGEAGGGRGGGGGGEVGGGRWWEVEGVVVVVVVRTRCLTNVSVDKRQFLHLIGVTERLRVRLPGSPSPRKPSTTKNSWPSRARK